MVQLIRSEANCAKPIDTCQQITPTAKCDITTQAVYVIRIKVTMGCVHVTFLQCKNQQLLHILCDVCVWCVCGWVVCAVCVWVVCVCGWCVCVSQ
jgi:hypothetical protein